ncbi:MAG: zinc-ribbon domain-containing protein [Lachnospiraceae bacterium]|nr:zinc-ribbon domain-containing protein [Lachnospiraceae bacterium]
MTCNHCGEEIAPGAKFCGNCGNKIEDIVANAAEETVEKAENVEENILTEEVNETLDENKSESAEEEKVERVYDAGDDNVSGPNLDNASSLGGFAEEPKATRPGSTGDGPIGFSIASLVCGILGILCCSCCGLGLIFSAAAITLGVISINKNCEGRGFAIAGIACGGVGVLLGLPIIIGGLVSSSSGNGVTDMFSDFVDSL